MGIHFQAPRWRAWLGTASLMAAHVVGGSPSEARTHDLGAIGSYTIQLQNVGRDIDSLAASDHDLLIVEPSLADDGKRRTLTAAEVARLKQKPDGSRRIVLAYMSVGEAEDYRDYWQQSWSTAPPPWIIGENCRWRGNHFVRYWDPGWQRILVSGPGSVLSAILAGGFDGVSLDRVDVFEEIESLNANARTAMISLVSAIAAKARASNPNFIVMAHNAENLIDDVPFRRVIDGVLKEDLLYGVAGTNKRNPPAAIDWSNNRLALLAEEGKPVLVAEYITDRDRADDTELELLERSFLPGIFPRALDGSSPLRHRAEATSAAATLVAGTPEHAAATCDGNWRRATSQ